MAPSAISRRTSGARTALVLGTLIVIAATVAAADVLLLALDRSEREAAASKLYQRAQSLASAGKNEEALEFLRMAHTEMRKRENYQIALIEGLQRVRRLDEAEAEAQRLVQQQPSAALSNIVMARVLAAQGRVDDAAWYYHRALYGNWPRGFEARRTQARLELADLLASHDRTEQVVAETLLLLNESGANAAVRRSSADLLLKAHSFARAASLYRELLSESPDDSHLHRGLGLALFNEGQFRQARTELAIAADLARSDAEVRRKLEVAEKIIELDPASKGIGLAERVRRSRKVLTDVLETASSCHSSVDTDEAQTLLGRKTKGPPDPDAYMRSAESLWSRIQPGCKTATVAEALTTIFNRS